MQSDNARREQRRVLRTRCANRERPNGNTGRHLGSREKRVQSLQRLRLYWHAEHGQPGVGGDYSGQMRRGAGTGLLAQLPAVISLTFLFGTFTFFSLFAGPYSSVIGTRCRQRLFRPDAPRRRHRR